MGFIQIEVERPTVRFFDGLPGQGGLIETGDEKRTQKPGILLSDETLGQRCQDDFPFVHHSRHVEPLSLLSNHVSNKPVPKEAIEPRQ